MKKQTLEELYNPIVGQHGSFTIDCLSYQIQVDYKTNFAKLSNGMPVDHFEFYNVYYGEEMPISETGYKSLFVYREQLENISVRDFAQNYAAENATVDMAQQRQLSLF